MLFNSFGFIFIFLPVTYFIWIVLCNLKKTKAALIWLLMCSLAFYGYWNPPYLLLLLISIAINYFIQNRIAESKLKFPGGSSSKNELIIGVIVNLILIGYFKYANFFAENIAPIFDSSWNIRNIFLPLGISFFTFQQIACLVDTYKGKIGVISPYRYALFVSFFPQLIAGPIVLADTLIPQFDNKRIYYISDKNICIGITLFTIGLFKKVVIADTFSPWVAAAFNADYPLTFIEAWGGALSYTFQIYFDFSGYSDMALGLGRFFNIVLPVNFNSPYKSTSIIEFWRRWHITLSNFLKEYLYIALGGNKKGKLRRYINLMLTMLLGGLWHGAGWTFVIWGGLHGMYLTINHLWRDYKPFDIPKIISWFITSMCIVVAWVFFRAKNTGQAFEILKGMAGINGVIVPAVYLPSTFHNFAKSLVTIIYHKTLIFNWTFFGSNEIIVIILALIMCITLPNMNSIPINIEKYKKYPYITAVINIIMFFFAILSMNKISEFLYFQF